MPKVKLSALVSDMKGKSNGSVFSSNSGGLYFRNNPSGGGRKSAKWAAQKSNVAWLSTQWKGLSIEQVEAWNSITSEYPTTNAFGDPRVPTGYELFMRLNGSLLAAGLPILSTPLSPRTLPSYTEFLLNSPNLYMFQPQRVLNMSWGNQYNWSAISVNFFQSFDMTQAAMYSCRFGLNSKQFSNVPQQELIPLFNTFIGADDNVQLYLYVDGSGNASLYCFFNLRFDDHTYWTYVMSVVIPKSVANSEMHISWAPVIGATPTANIFVNGLPFNFTADDWYQDLYLDPIKYFSTASPGTPAGALEDYSSVDGMFVIGKTADGYRIPYYISDFRFFPNINSETFCSLDADCGPGYSCVDSFCVFTGEGNALSDKVYSVASIVQYVAAGYIMGNETALVGFDTCDSGIFTNYGTGGKNYGFIFVNNPECTSDEDCSSAGLGTGNDVQCIDGVCVYVGDTADMLSGNPFTYAPVVVIENQNPSENDWWLVVSSTGPYSPGRNSNYVPKKRLAVIPWDGVNYDFHDGLKSLFGNFPGYSDCTLELHALDGTTGLIYDTVLPAKPRCKVKPCFKAGAELSGKVN